MQRRQTEDDGMRDYRMRVFAMLWGIATLFHINTVPLDTWSNIFLLVAAFLLIRFPDDRRLLILLAGLQIVDMWVYLPRGSNHWLHTSALNIVILIIFFTYTFRKQELSDTRFFSLLTPYVRVLALTLYFFAVFHKLNSDFLNPTVSCGAVLPKLFLQSVSDVSFGSELKWFGIASTLIIESLIPLLLLARRTCIFGVLLGLLFHTMLSLNPALPVADFTSFLIPLYYTFLPTEFTENLGRRMSGLPGRIPDRRRTSKRQRTILLCMVLLCFVLAPIALWLAYTICIGGIVTIYLSRDRLCQNLPPIHSSQSRRPGVLLFLGCLILNGISPHLGLKTELSLSMFSNLRTEFDANHLLLKDHVRVFDGYQDPIELLRGTDKRLVEKLAPQSPYGIAQFELDRTIRELLADLAEEGQTGELTVHFRRDSKTHIEVFAIERISVFRNAEMYLKKKLFPFRRIYLKSPTPCDH